MRSPDPPSAQQPIPQPMSLARRIEFATAGLVILFITFAGIISYILLSRHIAADSDAQLRQQANLIADHIEGDLQAITQSLSAFGQSAAVVQALSADAPSWQRGEPSIPASQLSNGHAIEVALIDRGGHHVAGSASLAQSPSMSASAPSDFSHRQVWLQDDPNGALLVVAEPVRDPRSAVLLGALLYRIQIAGLFDADTLAVGDFLRSPPLPVTVELSSTIPGCGGACTRVSLPLLSAVGTVTNRLGVSQPIDTGDLADDLSLQITVSVAQAELRKPLDGLILVHVLIGMSGIAIALLVSRAVSRSIARPLSELERVATTIVASNVPRHRFALEGPSEVIRLATAFNAMLARIDDADGRILKLSRYDALTGLANRTTFQHCLEERLATGAHSGTPVALFLIDIDDFKQINERLGQPAGDHLLSQVAKRLSAAGRDTDFVARLGGDEFAIITSPHRHAESIEALARKITACFQARFDLNGQLVVSTASIGISVACGVSQSADEFIREADLALCQVKAEGGNGYCFYSRELTNDSNGRKTTERLIRHLLATDGFLLNFQPKVHLATGSVVGWEALLRCPPEYARINIGQDLIPVAESSGLINGLGEWVIRAACQQARSWRNAGMPFLPIAINISAVQLRNPDLVDFVRNTLSTFELPPSLIELEITETAVMERTEVIGETIGRLRDLGLRLSVDDFGTGYSSLTYLKRFPVHALKIDRSFVDGVASGTDDAAIARAVIALGQSLGLEIVAEGVETEEQVAFLRAHGCHFAQGYLFSRPLAADALESWWGERRNVIPLRRVGAAGG